MPARALLNDVNPHLMHFLARLKRGLVVRGTGPEEETGEGGVEFLMETGPARHASKNQTGAQQQQSLPITLPAPARPVSDEDSPELAMANDETLYYRHRQRFNDLLRQGAEQTPEAAALFYYLNRTGFNGLCRFNRKGEFNVPFGKYSTITYVRDFTPYRRAFASWDLTSMDFEALALEPGDFIYADPPYDVEFTQYSKEAFGWDQQERTAEWLARHSGPVILSNQATNRIVALYRKLGYRLEFLQGPRRISCNGDRSAAREVLAFRNLPEMAEGK